MMLWDALVMFILSSAFFGLSLPATEKSKK